MNLRRWRLHETTVTPSTRPLERLTTVSINTGHRRQLLPRPGGRELEYETPPHRHRRARPGRCVGQAPVALRGRRRAPAQQRYFRDDLLRWRACVLFTSRCDSSSSDEAGGGLFSDFEPRCQTQAPWRPRSNSRRSRARTRPTKAARRPKVYSNLICGTSRLPRGGTGLNYVEIWPSTAAATLCC